MSQPIDELLSRFTPDGSGLDRDALLFAAGRASVRPNRWWMVLVACLGVSQVATLGALLLPALTGPGSPTPVLTHPGSPPVEKVVPTVPELPTAPPPEGPLTLRLRRSLRIEDLPRLTGIEDLEPDDPPLRAFTVSMPDLN